MNQDPSSQTECPFHQSASSRSANDGDVEESKLKASSPPRFYRQVALLGDPSDFLDGLIADYGDFIHYRGLFDFYLINEARLVSQLFKQTHRQFNKQTPIYRRFRSALGDSLVNAEGEDWKMRRKTMTPTFTPASANSFFDLMKEQTVTSLQDWGGETDLGEAMNRLALEVSGKALFSRSFDERSQDVFRWVKTVNHYSAQPPFPLVGAPWFPRPSKYRMKRSWKEFRRFVQDLIEERRQSEATNEDLFSVLIAMTNPETGAGFSDDEIAEEILGMIIGSHESTATSLTWLFYELGKNPAIHQSLLAEIDEVLGSKELAQEDLSSLPLLKQALHETLRLHPPFWFENRCATETVTLGGEVLEKGALVILSRQALHRNEKYWPDPHSFRPERFDENKVKVDDLIRAGHYVPFSSGPRICIGRHFAMLEMMLIAVEILQRFEVVVPEGQSGQTAAKLTMALRNGLKVQLKRRENSEK